MQLAIMDYELDLKFLIPVNGEIMLHKFRLIVINNAVLSSMFNSSIFIFISH